VNTKAETGLVKKELTFLPENCQIHASPGIFAFLVYFSY